MAMVGSLQSAVFSRRFSTLGASLPIPKPLATCPGDCQFRAFAVDCFHQISSPPGRTPKSSRRRCVRAGGGEILEGDVVEYPLSEEVRRGGLYEDRIRYGLGAVSELVSDPYSSSLLCHLEPLVMNEPPKATWVVDERQKVVVVPLTQVRRLEAWLSMRMVDDRISNPHGEHAEHLWLVEEPLSESSGSPNV